MAEMTKGQPWYLRALAYPVAALWLALYLVAEHPSHKHDDQD